MGCNVGLALALGERVLPGVNVGIVVLPPATDTVGLSVSVSESGPPSEMGCSVGLVLALGERVIPGVNVGTEVVSPTVTVGLSVSVPVGESTVGRSVADTTPPSDVGFHVG